MSEETTAITPEVSLDDKINHAKTALQTLAGELDEELGAQVLKLAALTSAGIKGMDDEEKASVAKLFLRQNSSSSEMIPGDCVPGQFFTSLGENLKDQFNFIPVKGHRMRRKWNDEGLECMSLDGKVGSRYGSCEQCPYGRFEKGVAPQCSPGHSYYVVAEDLSALYRIDFTKSSAAAGRNIKRLTLPPALWGRSFSLSSEHKKESGRNYYVMKVSPTGNRTDEDTMEICEALYEFFDALHKQALEAQARFAERLKETETAGTVPTTAEDVTVSDSDDEVMDFSDSV